MIDVPRYPQVRVQVCSDNPLALISAVRHALRRAGVPREEIQTFSQQAFAGGRSDLRTVCQGWARIDECGAP